MLHADDWELFEKVWAKRSALWREALAYVLSDGPVSNAQPILRRALFDSDRDVALQAMDSLCHQMIENPDECPLDETLLPRFRELRKTDTGDLPEVDILLQRYRDAD